MNKKIKSLIVAGVLVVSQSVTTFAMETNQFEGNDSNHETHQHEVGNGLVEQKMEANYIGLEYLKDENGNYPVELKFIHVKGSDQFNCYVLDENIIEANNLVSPLKNDEIPEISHITVVYSVKGDTPIVPPAEPEYPDAPNQVPGTGDMSVLPMVGLGGISAVGLLLANKKKRK